MEKEVSQGRAAVLGLQHLLAMYSGAVAVPCFNRYFHVRFGDFFAARTQPLFRDRASGCFGMRDSSGRTA